MEHKTGKNSYELKTCPGSRRPGLRIDDVVPGSAAEETGIEPGDILRSVNGTRVDDELDWIYLSAAVLLGAGFCAYGFALWRSYSDALARRTFRFSIVYLSLLFAALLVDHYLQ